MYIPAPFAETDLSALQAFIDRHGFAVLVSRVDGEPFATHLPLILDRTAGKYGTLLGHVARANPQWRELSAATSLAIFSGPHAYVSPSWYESERVVPTWNYTAVHATGRAELIEDEAGVLDILRRTTEFYESGMPRPWSFAGSDPFVNRLVPQLVGFRLEIRTIEGKNKLSQNQPAERRENVARALRRQSDPESVAVADLMDRLAPRDEDGRTGGR